MSDFPCIDAETKSRRLTEGACRTQILRGQALWPFPGQKDSAFIFFLLAGHSGDHRMSSDISSRLISPGLVTSHHRQTLEHPNLLCHPAEAQ